MAIEKIGDRELEHAKPDPYYAAFVLAIETGMRPEEYLGLKWGDIDFDHSRLSVRRALVVRKGGGIQFHGTKDSSESARHAALPNCYVGVKVASADAAGA